MDKKLIAVCGATGSQGGSVLNYLLDSGRYRVRALTRNQLTPKCLGLKTKWGSDIEFFQCNMENADEMIKAFTGCWGAYLVTDFWQDPKKMIDQEFPIGRILIDSAVQANVRHCVWSTLHNVDAISQGTLTVPHFTNKALVEEYARNEFKGSNISTTFSFVYPGFYMQNFLYMPGQGLKLTEEGLLTNDPLPLEPTTRLPMLNINEFGGFVLPLFDRFEEFNGGRMFAYNGWTTIPEFLSWVADKLGTKAKYIQCTYDEYFQFTQDTELVHMFRFFNEYGYYGSEQLGIDPKKYFSGLSNLRDAVESVDWKSSVKPGIPQQISTKIGEISGVIIEKLGALKETIVETAEQLRGQLFARQAE